MPEVLTMGELLVEIMRPDADMPLDRPGLFYGPFPSGAPAIFIDTVARLGHSAGIVGGVGEDEFGTLLRRRLQGDGVDCSLVLSSKEGSTGSAFVSYASDGSRKFIFHIGNTPAAWAKAPDPAQLEDVKYFHIMGCSLTADAEFGKEIVKTMRACVKKGAKVSFDPNIRPELLRDAGCMRLIDEVMKAANVFLPGVQELLMLTGEDDVERAIEGCFANPALDVLAIKNGSQGCAVMSRSELFSMGVYPVEVKDPTGAGDCFDGAFLCALLEGKPLSEAARMASAAAALNTAAFGPMEGDISPENIQKMMREESL